MTSNVIDWRTHKHVYTSELGWQAFLVGSLKCECGAAYPYDTITGLREKASSKRELNG